MKWYNTVEIHAHANMKSKNAAPFPTMWLLYLCYVLRDDGTHISLHKWNLAHWICVYIYIYICIILCMYPANEGPRCNVTSYLIGCVLTQNNPCIYVEKENKQLYCQPFLGCSTIKSFPMCRQLWWPLQEWSSYVYTFLDTQKAFDSVELVYWASCAFQTCGNITVNPLCPCFNINTVMIPSYLYNMNSYVGKMVSLYWDSPQGPVLLRKKFQNVKIRVHW